jgi:hypothetical protein
MVGILTALPSPAEEDPFHCDTPNDAPGMGLEKSSASPLPRIREYKGTLKAMVFRAEFADVPSNVTEATIASNNTIINDFYKAMSRNKFYWEFSIYPQVLKAPGTLAEFDNGSFNKMQSWISEAVKATGLVRNTDYHVYNITFPKLSTAGFSGRSSGGTSGQNYLNGSYGTGVTSHEMGHTVGLAHAHAIEAGADMFGTPGTTSQHVEYGHPFDNMGRGGSTGHFNICYKYRDGWTDGEGVEVIEVRNSGVYRLYAHDNPDHQGRLLGIRVPAGDSNYGYWFEYRTNNANNRRGASVMFDGWNGTSSRADTWFMDLTPQTTTENDGVMTPDMEFKDKYGAATFKVLAVNPAPGPGGWVDVQVNIPGTIPIFPRLAQRPHHQGTADWRIFDLTGRILQNRGLAQILTLRSGNGQPPRLVLQTH